MRILILSIYHDPEPIPKTGELARELRRRGHTVTVVTAFPHYPSGQLYAGYRLTPWRWEERDGIRVLRTYVYPYHGRRSSLRILNYVSWMLSSIQAVWLAPACDVVYVWHPPLTVGVSAWVISRLKRVKFVYDVQDLWPESALASGLMRPGWLVGILYRLADWVYARADRLLVVSRAAADHLAARGVDPGKIRVASHWLDAAPYEAVQDDVAAAPGEAGRFRIAFAGNLGLVQGLDTILEAVALLARPLTVDLVFAGDGADRERLAALAEARGLPHVRFLGQRPASEMPALLRAADALVVHLRRSAIAEHAIPTKILAYMAAGRPILCATGGAAAALVEEAGAGLIVPPDDPPALASAIERLASMSRDERRRLGENGLRYFRARFEKTRVIDMYEAMLLEMRPGRRAPPAVPAGERT
jgi:colanic acid biosynthesis glycosyl transferase WcaI